MKLLKGFTILMAIIMSVAATISMIAGIVDIAIYQQVSSIWWMVVYYLLEREE